MIYESYMELPGKCTNEICAHDKRDGEEVSCVQKEPKSTHPDDWKCKYCNFWKSKVTE